MLIRYLRKAKVIQWSECTAVFAAAGSFPWMGQVWGPGVRSPCAPVLFRRESVCSPVRKRTDRICGTDAVRECRRGQVLVVVWIWWPCIMVRLLCFMVRRPMRAHWEWGSAEVLPLFRRCRLVPGKREIAGPWEYADCRNAHLLWLGWRWGVRPCRHRGKKRGRQSLYSGREFWKCRKAEQLWSQLFLYHGIWCGVILENGTRIGMKSKRNMVSCRNSKIPYSS